MFLDKDVEMSTAQPILKKRKPNQSYPPGLGFCGSEPQTILNKRKTNQSYPPGLGFCDFQGQKDSSMQLFDGAEN